MAGVRAGILPLMVVLAACEASPPPPPPGPSAEEIAAQAERACVERVGAKIYTGGGGMLGAGDMVRLIEAVPPADMEGCPLDFIEAMTRFKGSAEAAVEADAELRRHALLEDEKMKQGFIEGLGEAITGTQGASPYADWRRRKAELEALVPQTVARTRDAAREFKAVMARYGVVVTPATAPAADAMDATTEAAGDAAEAAGDAAADATANAAWNPAVK